MSDLISRQAAIDAAMEELDGGTPYDIPNKIMALPSAQPDVPDTNVGDCISRQAVVKFFNDWISCLDENCHHQSVADMIIIKNDFKNLPSAQPEPFTDKEQRIFLATTTKKTRRPPMTIGEAIQCLNEISDKISEMTLGQRIAHHEAIDMAIQALRKETDHEK